MKVNLFAKTVSALFIGYFCILFNFPQAQSQCSVSSNCLDLGDPQEYTTIESSVSDPLTFQFLIATGKLLDATNSLIMPQRLIICGPIVANLVQYTFASGSEIIFVDNSSGITVNTNCRLEFKGTHIHGCTQLWRSLRVFGRLDIVEGCKIEDAINAVQLNDGSTFVSSMSEYDGNYISIYAGAAVLPPNVSVSLAGFTITGSTFVGAKPLLQSYTPPGTTEVYTAPNTGILTENVSAIQVGVPSALTNIFRDFQSPNSGISPIPVRGIRARKSNLTVQNCTFRNIGMTDGSSLGFGVSGISTTGTNSVTVTGLGGTASSPSTFENVYRAVSAESVRLFVSHCRVVGCNLGIFERRSSSLNSGVFQINIHHNRIENACFNGIQLQNTMPSKSVIIADNWIAFNQTGILCTDKRRGYCKALSV